MYSKLLVTLQFTLIGLIVLYSDLPIHDPFLFSLALLAGIIGLWAILSMKLNNLRIQPIPKENAQLITSGVYKFIRHPMYTSVLLLMSAFIFAKPDAVSISLFVALIIIILLKLTYEEKLLEQKFLEYKRYAKKTWRLIPYIY